MTQNEPVVPALSPRNICLDGIRGIAIVLVLIHHAFESTVVTNGFSAFVFRLAASCWLGVDLFFVLSGFLITGILLKSRGSPHYFRIFYARRFFRIFPLYYASLGALALVGLAIPSLWNRVHFAWNISYLANLRVALYGWSGRPTDHLWTLSTEEQFYFLWPALIFLVPRRRLTASIAVLLFALIAIRQYLGSIGVNNLVIYTLLHLDGLLLGAALAVYRHEATRHEATGHEATRQEATGTESHALRRAWAALLAMGLLLAELFFRDGALNWRVWSGFQLLTYTVIAVAGTALIAVSVYSPPRAFINRLLQWRPLVATGKYSYAIYIFHIPIDDAFWSLHLRPSTVNATILYTFVLWGVSFACAFVSWKLLEEPSLRFRDRWFSYETPGQAHVAEPRL